MDQGHQCSILQEVILLEILYCLSGIDSVEIDSLNILSFTSYFILLKLISTCSLGAVLGSFGKQDGKYKESKRVI